jgi:hypothetical protein
MVMRHDARHHGSASRRNAIAAALVAAILAVSVAVSPATADRGKDRGERGRKVQKSAQQKSDRRYDHHRQERHAKDYRAKDYRAKDYRAKDNRGKDYYAKEHRGKNYHGNRWQGRRWNRPYPVWSPRPTRIHYYERRPFYHHTGFNVFFGGDAFWLEVGNVPPPGYIYYDPYCHHTFASVALFRRHIHRHHHPALIEVIVVDDDYDYEPYYEPVYDYHDGCGDDEWWDD